ncbi:MAG: ribosome small subunit-dependent GTPase A [Flavobacteriales bacterium]
MDRTGLVIKSTGKWYKVRMEDGDVVDAQIRGKFRIQGLKTTNPLAVGDHVTLEEEKDETWVINTILERKNYIIRKSVNLSKQSHIIASNIDQAFLFVTVARPQTSYGFIDRFLVTAEAYKIPVVILINKMDDYDEFEMEKVIEIEDIYTGIGYEVMKISALQESSVATLKNRFTAKVSMLGGHSGAGKSTLVNAISPGLDIKVMEVSASHNKGQHTTTFAEMHELDDGGFIIDTPGIKGFGIVDIEKDELHMLFPEMMALFPECKFNNCRHINEPKCAVLKAIEDGNIEEVRYRSYLAMYEDEQSSSYR